MKSLFFFLAFLPLSLLAQVSGYTVSGNFSGLADGTQVRLVNANDTTQQQKTVAKAQSFVLKGNLPEPALFWLILGKEQPQYIYLENTNITVKGDVKDLKNMRVFGSQSNTDFDAFRGTFNPLVAQLNVIAGQINNANEEQKRAELMQQYVGIRNQVQDEVGKFIAARPSSYVSPFLLYVTAQLLDDPVLLEKRLQSLAPAVQASQIGKMLAEYIAYNKVGAVGTDALDFTMNDPSGKPVALSSFRGKYVLLDFWASWCKPCRMENPNVVRTYQKFSKKNFTVFGVSLDREKEPWLKAIQTDSLAWTQVSDLKFWDNSAAVMYHVQGIPQNFLIDPQGKIIGRNLRGEELEAKLCEVLGCN